jgi:predicted ATP-grasp superfamily ATP-dependent carboligase
MKKILLLDEGLYQTLYVSRKLQAFADITIACSNPRWIKRAKKLPVKLIATKKPDSPDYLQELNTLAPNFDVIIPISNDTLPLAYENDFLWQEKVFPRIPKASFSTANNKLLATRHAEQLGIRCPLTIAVNHRNELNTTAEKLGFPLIIKTAIGCAGIGVRICHNQAELLQAYDLLSKKNVDIFCQQFISGDTFGASGLFYDGVILRNYCWQKTTMHPPLIGPSKRCLSTTDPVLNQLMTTLATSLDWHGLIDMDFICDAQGNYYFLEINPRVWGSIAATEDAGVDMITPLWEMLQGKTPKADLHCRDKVDSALFPQYFLAACKEDSYARLWQMLTDKSLWGSAPNDIPYLNWYKQEIAHAWLHSLRRTVFNSLKQLAGVK